MANERIDSTGRIEVLGDVNKTWKEFDVKLPGTQTESAELQKPN